MRYPFLVLFAMLLAACSAEAPLPMLGAYALDDGRIVSIRRSVDETLRYRVYDSGESGRLFPVSGGEWVSGEGFSGREPVTLRVRFTGEDSIRWNSGAGEHFGVKFLSTEPFEFDSSGTMLRGELHIPAGPGPFSAVALVHGSGKDAATAFFYMQDFFAANGVAALVYDKRGTGRSEGDFTFDYQQLARDAAAGVDALADSPVVDPDRIGLVGYSQGGWVAPLAAAMNPRVSFVAVAYGMIESPTDEAIWETQDLLRSRGVDEVGIDEATPLIRSAVKIVGSGFDDGWDEFHAAKRATEGADWRDKLDGSPVERMLSYPKWITRLVGPRIAPPGLDWNYSSDAVLDSLEIPMTWMLGAEDSSAPNHETIRKLRAYREAGKPYELVLFEGADHGMLLFEEQGERRVYTRYAPDYFRTEVAAVLRMSERN